MDSVSDVLSRTHVTLGHCSAFIKLNCAPTPDDPMLLKLNNAFITLSSARTSVVRTFLSVSRAVLKLTSARTSFIRTLLSMRSAFLKLRIARLPLVRALLKLRIALLKPRIAFLRLGPPRTSHDRAPLSLSSAFLKVASQFLKLTRAVLKLTNARFPTVRTSLALITKFRPQRSPTTSLTYAPLEKKRRRSWQKHVSRVLPFSHSPSAPFGMPRDGHSRIASAHDQIQARVDASKIRRIARYDCGAVTACQESNAGIHNVPDTALAAQGTGRLRLLSVQCLDVNEARSKQPCKASLSTAVSPHLRHDSTGRVYGTTVR